MMCALTVRRLKPGSYDEFRRAWEPDPYPEALTRAYHLRNQEHPDEVVSFGFLDVTAEELDRLRDDPAFLEAEGRRMARMAPFEAEVLVNSVFEVVEEVVPPGRA